jgi:hypothetical protein
MFQLRVEAAMDPRLILELMGLSFDGGNQTEVVQHAWAQLRGDSSDGVNCRANSTHHPFDLRSRVPITDRPGYCPASATVPSGSLKFSQTIPNAVRRP